MCIRFPSGLSGGREGNVLATDGSRAQSNTRRRKGDCRRPKRSRGISREAIERTHGGCGVGEKNEEGERVAYFAMAFDFSIINTFFWKRPNHIETYKSGGRESQIHFLTCRRQQLK